MTTVFLDALFKPFVYIRPWYGPTTDDRSDEFPDGWLPSNHSTYGVCECKHAISNTPKGKNHTLKDRESEGVTARLRNGKWGARETCFEQWSLTCLHCYWSGQPRGKECRPPRPPPRPTYLVLPIQKMSGSRGSPCTSEKLFGFIRYSTPCPHKPQTLSSKL